MKLNKLILLALFCVVGTVVYASEEDHEEHEGFESAAAIDVEEPEVVTFVLQKGEHEEHEGEEDGHDHRRLSGEGEEAEYEYPHLKLVVVHYNESCTEESIEIAEDAAIDLLEDNTTVYLEVDAFNEPLNISQDIGVFPIELHVAEQAFISLFFFQALEEGCLVLYSEHTLEDGFLREASGEEIEPSFVEPAAAVLGNYPAEVWLISLGATLLVSLISLIGILFIALGLGKEEDGKSGVMGYMNELLTFAFGILLGVVFVHIIPEANEFYGDFDFTFGIVTFAALMAAFVIKLLIGHSHDGSSTIEAKDILDGETGQTAAQASVIKGSASANILWGDAFHNFTDGILIGTAFGACAADATLGWLVTASVVLHEIPQEFADFLVIYRDYGSIAVALCFNFISAGAAFIGVITVLALGELSEYSTGILFAINIGALLFITLGEIGPQISQVDSKREAAIRVLIAIAGFAVICFLEYAPHEHCEAGGAHDHDH